MPPEESHRLRSHLGTLLDVNARGWESWAHPRVFARKTSLKHSNLNVIFLFAGCAAQWQNTCLECVMPWAPSPVMTKNFYRTFFFLHGSVGLFVLTWPQTAGGSSGSILFISLSWNSLVFFHVVEPSHGLIVCGVTRASLHDAPRVAREHKPQHPGTCQACSTVLVSRWPKQVIWQRFQSVWEGNTQSMDLER